MKRPPNWTHILVHHSAGHDTDGLDLDAIRRFHVEGRGWLDIGYHDVVEQIGGVYVALRGRSSRRAGAHSPGWNRKALGVCLVGDFTNAPPPAEQLEVAAELIADLCVEHAIPLDHVLPHREVRRTACPGAAFPWPLLVQMVERRLPAAA